MKLTVIGSSSAGNCYLIHNETEAIVIEAGKKVTELKKALDFNLNKVSGVLISHSHGDHAGQLRNYLNEGLKCYGSESTALESGVAGHPLYKSVDAGQSFYVGNFRVVAFDMIHDVRCFGFLIDHLETGRFIFITDSHYSPAKFNGLSNIIVEANYSEKIISEKLSSGEINKAYVNRVYYSHMSLETCICFLRSNDLSKVMNIVLIHLSDRNSHADDFQYAATQATGKQVHIAEPGMEIDFDRKPF